MSAEVPEIPDTPDELLAAIDKSKAEKPSPEVIADLHQLISQMLEDSPAEYDSYHEDTYKRGYFQLVDGREVEVEKSLDPRHDYDPSSWIRIIDHKVKDGQQIRGIRKTYFVSDIEAATSTKDFLQDDRGIPFQEFESDWDEDTTEDQTIEDAEQEYEQMKRAVELAHRTGINQTSNEELVNLMRLLKTSEQIVPQAV